MTMEHGAPVEATAWLPGGSLLATAGGTEMKCAAACSQDMLCTCIMQHLYWHSCPYALGIPYMLPSGPKPLAVAIFLSGEARRVPVFATSAFKLCLIHCTFGAATTQFFPLVQILMGTITRVECSVSLCSVRRIWNVLAGGQLLARLANHQKTVTSLCTASSAGPAATSAPRLLSGSLDGHVKVLPFLLRPAVPSLLIFLSLTVAASSLVV